MPIRGSRVFRGGRLQRDMRVLDAGAAVDLIQPFTALGSLKKPLTRPRGGPAGRSLTRRPPCLSSEAEPLPPLLSSAPTLPNVKICGRSSGYRLPIPLYRRSRPRSRAPRTLQPRALIPSRPVAARGRLTKCSDARCRGLSAQLHDARNVVNSSSCWMSAITRWRAVSSSSRNASSQIASWPRPPQAKAGGEYSKALPPGASQL